MQDSTLNLLLVLGVGIVGGYAVSQIVAKKREQFLELEVGYDDEMTPEDYADLYPDESNSFESESDFDPGESGEFESESFEPPPALRDWDKKQRKAKAAAKRAAKATGKYAKKAGRAVKSGYQYTAPRLQKAAKAGYAGAIDYGKKGALALDDLTVVKRPASAEPLPKERAKTLFQAPSPSAYTGSAVVAPVQRTQGVWPPRQYQPVAPTLVETEFERVGRLFGPDLVAAVQEDEMRQAGTRVSRPNGRRRSRKYR